MMNHSTAEPMMSDVLDSEHVDVALSISDLFPDATLRLPVRVPRRPRTTVHRGVGRALRRAFEPIAASRPQRHDSPGLGFWSVYTRQRGLARTEDLWLRERPIPPLRGRSSIRITHTYEGAVGDLSWYLGVALRRTRATSAAAARQAPGGLVVLSTRLPWQGVADQRMPASLRNPVGWSAEQGYFSAWSHVPAVNEHGQWQPVVDAEMMDWFCLQANAAATACIRGTE